MSSVVPPLHIVTPVTLQGSAVRLEPIRREHAEIFWEVAKGALDDIFQWFPYRMQTREDFQHLVEKTVEIYGRLDCACNNAGIGNGFGPIHE